MAHPDLPVEQAHLDRAYDRLEAVRAETQAQLRAAFSERGGTFQSYTERDIRVRNSLNRLEKLQLGRESLIFGRIDRAGARPDGTPTPTPTPTPAAASDAPTSSGPPRGTSNDHGRGGDPDQGVSSDHGGGWGGEGREAEVANSSDHGGGWGGEGREAEVAEVAESFHIGRLAISDRDHEPLVVDWRAPVAEPFYRATGAHPMGLRRRRHFLTDGRKVLDLEDELFAPDNPDGTAGAFELSGPSVLRAALERAHTGRMRDIVATVQAEQDEIIRASLSGALVVQGGPGTGKTAVALHRAAYLLYTHRFPLEGQGVLVVGPNPTFLRYIDQVLPSLGETGVELSTATGLYSRARPVALAAEPAEVARLKGDPRMAQVIRRAVRQRQRPLRKSAQIPYGTTVLTLSPQGSEQIIATARRRAGTHNARRRLVETLLWQYLTVQLERRPPAAGLAGLARVPGASNGSDGGAAEAVRPAQLGAALRRRPEMAEILERMWPRLSAEELLHDLLGAKPLVEQAGRGVLDPHEMALLHRLRSSSSEEVAWTAADIALLDEASSLLGPARPSRANELQHRTYGHIVVDEAQDLTPMELRMVGRRSLSGSMTVVGDIAQATGPWAPASWEDVKAHLPVLRGWHQVSLSVSYRAPAEVMELAARVLTAALPGTVPPEPVRHTGHSPALIAAPGGLGPAVARTVAQELVAESSPSGGEDGSVGVLVPAELVAEVRAALEEAGIAFGEVGAGALDGPVSLLALVDAKGLEFDSAVVVEPARIVASGPHGMRALYVALTRCTRRLAIVYRERLPAPLQDQTGDLRAGQTAPGSGPHVPQPGWQDP